MNITSGFDYSNFFKLEDPKYACIGECENKTVSPLTSEHQRTPAKEMRVVKSSEKQPLFTYYIDNGEIERSITCSRDTSFVLSNGRAIKDPFVGANLQGGWQVVNVEEEEEDYVYNLVGDEQLNYFINLAPGQDLMIQGEVDRSQKEKISISAYDLERQMVQQCEKPLSDIQMKTSFQETYEKNILNNWKKRYYMFLCRDMNDYTIFDTSNMTKDYFVNTIVALIKSRGNCLRIDVCPDHTEVWLQYENENEPMIAMFFNCDGFFIS